MPTWLEAHHARWATGRDVLEAVVRDGGFTPIGFERVIVGQANEVYAVDTAEGEGLVLRLSHRPDPKLFTEVAVIEVVRARGIPAPEVIAVGPPPPFRSVGSIPPNPAGSSRQNERETGGVGAGAGAGAGGGATAFILERRMPGVMLAELFDSEGVIDHRALEPLGEIVAAIHDVTVDGFGNLSPSLQGTHDDYATWFVDMFIDAHLPDALDAVAGDAEATTLVHRAVEAMEAGRTILDAIPGRLAHGDLSPTNVLVDPSTGAITGIVDWESVKGAPQPNDFAWWTMVSPHGRATLDVLLRGYCSVCPLDDGFWDVYRLSRLRIITTTLGYAAQVGDDALLARARDTLSRTFSTEV